MKNAFLTRLTLEDDGNGSYRHAAPFRFFSRRIGRVVEIPRGFPTDLASARIGNWQLRGETERAAAIHDLLFATGEVGIYLAGLIFYDFLRISGVGRLKATIYALAATFTPGARKAWHSHRAGHSKAAKFLRSGKNHLMLNEP